MPRISYQDSTVQVEAPETVLEGLERAGFEIPYSCRSGLCHSCMMQADSQPPPTAQQGLTENQKLQNYFLACSCIPKADMAINLIGDTDKIQGRVAGKRMLNESVLALLIETDCPWFPGQYLTLWKDEIQGRSYSIASRCELPQVIELHIKRHDQGLVSRWLHDDVAEGDVVALSKPMGNCFYTDNHHHSPMLMASTGTGLAPLYGVLQEALAQEHDREIYLYTAAGEPTGLYYVEELKKLAAEHDKLHYIPVVRRNAPVDDEWIEEQDLVDLIKTQHTDLKDWKVFLCGSPEMIKEVQRHCFFKGAAISDILVDAFVIEAPKS